MNFESGMAIKLSRLIVADRRRTGRLGLLFACLALLLAGAQAHAACKPTRTFDDAVATFPATISVPPDTPNNTVVADVFVALDTITAGQYATCTGGGTVSWAVQAGSIVPNRAGATSVPGISYRAYLGLSGVTASDSLDTQHDAQSLSGGPDAPAFGSGGAGINVQFVKTGPVTPGPLTVNPSGPGVAGRFASFFAGNGVVFNVKMGGATSVVVPTCTVTTPTRDVPVDPIAPKALTGIGSTAGNASVSLGLNCSGSGTQIFITLTDNADPTNTSNQLSLKSGSTASGVKLQVLSKGTPVKFGPDSSKKGNTNQWKVAASAAGPIDIPLTVRYIQSAATVQPGSVNAVATFTMSYQ